MANVLDNMPELEGLSLGKKLRRLTEQAKVNVEAQALIQILVDAANIGEDHVYFPDLRSVMPNMIMNETAFRWIEANELKAVGQINQNTAAYEYTISW